MSETEKSTETLKATLKALEPEIERNILYFNSQINSKKWAPMSEEAKHNLALHNSLTKLVGFTFKWEPTDNFKMAVELVEDVNYQSLARQVEELLKGE